MVRYPCSSLPSSENKVLRGRPWRRTHRKGQESRVSTLQHSVKLEAPQLRHLTLSQHNQCQLLLLLHLPVRRRRIRLSWICIKYDLMKPPQDLYLHQFQSILWARLGWWFVLARVSTILSNLALALKLSASQHSWFIGIARRGCSIDTRDLE